MGMVTILTLQVALLSKMPIITDVLMNLFAYAEFLTHPY